MSLRQENKARARHNILAAAAELLELQGIADTTTRQIAKRAGVSYQTLYNYFPTKAQVIQGLMMQDIADWGLAVDATIKQYDGDLMATLATINRIGLDEVRGPKLELWRTITLDLFSQGINSDQAASLNQIAHERYYALLSMAQGMGQLDLNIDLHLMAHTLFCLSDHALLRFSFSPDQDEEAFLDTLLQQMALLLTPYFA